MKKYIFNKVTGGKSASLLKVGTTQYLYFKKSESRFFKNTSFSRTPTLAVSEFNLILKTSSLFEDYHTNYCQLNTKMILIIVYLQN